MIDGYSGNEYGDFTISWSISQVECTVDSDCTNSSAPTCDNGICIFVPPVVTCVFEAVPSDECPSGSESERMDDCSTTMPLGDLCEADQTLPDGNSNYDVSNCPGGYDV